MAWIDLLVSVRENGGEPVVWKAYNYAYGRTVTEDAIGGIGLGFPGQYFDQETGLWYNGFRDYDAIVGRYAESDPVGISGGINTYGYVNANPHNKVDPQGLQAVPPGLESMARLGMSPAQYGVKCEADRQTGDKLERNRALVKCLAAKAGYDAAQAIGEAVAVATLSEVGGPEIGLPVTLLYTAFSASKLKKAYDAFGSAQDIVECLQQAYGQ